MHFMSDPHQQHLYHYAVNAHGQWSCEGNPVTDPELFRFLSRCLDEKNGRYFIRCEGEVHPVQVEDAPLWVHCVHVEADSNGDLKRVEIELADGRREPLKAETLTVAQGEALYCRATPRGLKARFGKLAYYELTRYLQMDPDEETFYFLIAGCRFDIREDTPNGAAA